MKNNYNELKKIIKILSKDTNTNYNLLLKIYEDLLNQYIILKNNI